MKLTPVKEVPSKMRTHGSLQSTIDEFMSMDCDIVLLDKSGYKGARSLYSSMWRAVRISKRPIKMAIRNDEVYLYKIK